MTPTSFRELEQHVIQAGGLMETTMEVLRDLVGAGKLGVNVRDEIRRGLRKRDLVVLGGRLPGDQRNTVWLISRAAEGGQHMLESLAFINLEKQTRPSIDKRDAA